MWRDSGSPARLPRLDRAQRPHSSPPHHELLDEVKEAAAPAVASLGQDMRVEIDDLVGMLTGNLEKIAEHGRRADGIVKSMLEHSRGASSERREVSRWALMLKPRRPA